MAGDGRTAIAAAEKLSRVVSNEATRHIPWVQPIKAAPYFAHAQFSAPETVLTFFTDLIAGGVPVKERRPSARVLHAARITAGRFMA